MKISASFPAIADTNRKAVKITVDIDSLSDALRFAYGQTQVPDPVCQEDAREILLAILYAAGAQNYDLGVARTYLQGKLPSAQQLIDDQSSEDEFADLVMPA